MIITIDGPTASGKTTVGKKVAQKLDMFYLYSGSLFRLLAYVLSTQYNFSAQTIAQISAQEVADIVTEIALEYKWSNGEYHLFVDGVDVTELTTNDEFGLLASIVGVNRSVREYIAHWQKEIVKNYTNCIIEGRDAGTYVFPHADKKLFITASQDERARRLQHKQYNMGKPITLDEALARIKERDDRDINREIAPLKIANDAIVIDNTHLDAHETLEKIIEIIGI